MKQIAILGSTGSIGTQTLDVVRQHPHEFSVYALSANRSVDMLIHQALEFNPAVVCIADESCYPRLRDALSDLPIQVLAGENAIAEMVTMPAIDIVVAAMVGYAGLRPTIEAIRAKKPIALANKETLVVAGEIICRLAQRYNVPILPVDSEHSVIFQSLVGESRDSLEKLLLTASGGPFRTFTYEQMQHVTAAQALRHPNWEMGAKITIDSASMMNKGFEVIEARWLFDIPVEKIQVLVHPQSVVHSAVQFVDGSVKAQLGTPDMRIPIQYAINYPNHVDNLVSKPLNLSNITLNFKPMDKNRFKIMDIVYTVLEKGKFYPVVFNASNEVLVDLFLKGKITFDKIVDGIIEEINKTEELYGDLPYTLENILKVDEDVKKRLIK